MNYLMGHKYRGFLFLSNALHTKVLRGKCNSQRQVYCTYERSKITE
jgi:hypothetical protein